MTKPPKKTLKEYVEGAAERLGRSKIGSQQVKDAKPKSLSKPIKEKKK
jgi:hypothetical protein